MASEYWLWTYVSDRTGKRVRTGWRMTAEDAAQYRDAERVPGTLEVREPLPLLVPSRDDYGPIGAGTKDDGFRLLVCGGRDYTDQAAAFAALDRADQRRHVSVVIHGAARGADTLAMMWARARQRRDEAFPADWSLGPGAGPERNARMLREGRPDAVCALPGGRGTADMTRRAEAAGLPIWRPYG